jgi:tetratricopeptide (TPR) repeat protein/tRNA A-37 threonylcarbamoyl transferase component Bud32
MTTAAPEDRCLDDDSVASYAEGVLSEGERLDVERHVDGCLDCRELLSEYGRLYTPTPPKAEGPEPPEGGESLEPGTCVDRYVILYPSGGGGMGSVYAAYDPELDRKIALKLVRRAGGTPQPPGSFGQALLQREAKALARLRHPNVVQVYDVGREADRIFIAMEYVEGANVAQWLRTQRRTFREVVRVFADAGAGLAAAHAAHLIHGDVKADNILLATDGRVYLSDFGLHSAPATAEAEASGRERDARAFLAALAAALESGSGAKAVLPGHLRRVLSGGAPLPDLLRELGRDPQRSRWRWMGAVSGALLAASAAGGWKALSRERMVQCVGRADDPAALWGPGLRQLARAAFANTGKSYAPQVWQQVERQMDAYARAWAAARVDACEARWRLGEQTEPQLGLRLSCLEDRLGEFNALTSVFAEADAATLQRADGAVSQLAPVAGCADLTALQNPRATVPPRLATAVAQARRELAEVNALIVAGKGAEAAKRLPAIAERTQALGVASLEAEVEMAESVVARNQGDYPASRAALERAFAAAEASSSDALAARALVELVGVVGSRLRRIDEGRSIARLARGVVDRLGGDERLSALLERAMGELESEAGNREVAVEDYRRSLATVSKLIGPESEEAAELHARLAWVLMEGSRLDEARSEVHRGLEIRERLWGPDHPRLIFLLTTAAAISDREGRFEDSIADDSRVLALVERAVGPRAPLVVRGLINLAQPLVLADRLDEATAVVDRLDGLLADSPAGALERALALEARSEILAARGRFAEAEPLLEQSIELLAKDGASQDVQTGLARAALAEIRVDRGHFPGALASAEAALEVLGKGEPGRVNALQSRARALVGLRRWGEARAAFDEALALTQAIPVRPDVAPMLRFYRAEADWAEGKAPARALADARAARDAQAPFSRPALREMDAWLAARGGKH